MRNETLIAARKLAGKTQAQVAAEIGVVESVYQRYEHGTRIPNAIMGNKIARVLGTTSEKIWGYKESI